MPLKTSMPLAPACAHHTACQQGAMAQAEALCARHHAQFTPIRRQVFSILWQSHKALTAAEIMAALGNNQPPVTYRALRFLESLGLIHAISSLNAYIGCNHPNRAHTGLLLVCTTCRTVIEADIPPEPLIQATQNHHFEAQHIHLEALGQCQACRALNG